MARGELMKKLLGSYGHADEFRAVAEQIITEEEKKNNRVLARTLRRALEHSTINSFSEKPKSFTTLAPFPDIASDFVERVEPTNSHKDIMLSFENIVIFKGLIKEFRHSEEIRKQGLDIRSKLLFCGPPGCGKTLCAEVFSAELGLPLFIVKLDKLISSYLGETATNIRKIFEFAQKQSCVLFLDEFDAIARSRDDSNEHNELRRVVNSLLLFIDRINPKGFMIAATNLDSSIDSAIWRRFDEVIWFDKPKLSLIKKYIVNKFKNSKLDFDPLKYSGKFDGFSFADIERVCNQTIKLSIVNKRKLVSEGDFLSAINDEYRRRAGRI